MDAFIGFTCTFVSGAEAHPEDAERAARRKDSAARQHVGDRNAAAHRDAARLQFHWNRRAQQVLPEGRLGAQRYRPRLADLRRGLQPHGHRHHRVIERGSEGAVGRSEPHVHLAAIHHRRADHIAGGLNSAMPSMEEKSTKDMSMNMPPLVIGIGEVNSTFICTMPPGGAISSETRDRGRHRLRRGDGARGQQQCKAWKISTYSRFSENYIWRLLLMHFTLVLDFTR